LYTVDDITHGTPVDPGSAASQRGTTGTHYIASICLSSYIAADFGPASTTAPSSSASRRRLHHSPASPRATTRIPSWAGVPEPRQHVR
jgi:feruloyl esterase